MTFEFFRLSFSSAISDTWRGQLRCSFATVLVVFESSLAPAVTPGFTVLYGIASERRRLALSFLVHRCFGFGKNLSGKFRAAVLSGPFIRSLNRLRAILLIRRIGSLIGHNRARS
jgi:hypothetical protein